jgi:hypothetical protein
MFTEQRVLFFGFICVLCGEKDLGPGVGVRNEHENNCGREEVILAAVLIGVAAANTGNNLTYLIFPDASLFCLDSRCTAKPVRNINGGVAQPPCFCR